MIIHFVKIGLVDEIFPIISLNNYSTDDDNYRVFPEMHENPALL